MVWIPYNNGNTIGKIGSESGTIIEDIEHIGGARITIEKDGSIAPYAITLGIYQLMFHTHFANKMNDANKFVEFAKFKIQDIFYHYEIIEELRDEYWQRQLDQLLRELSEQ
jgi:hypothetical protein